MKDTNLVTITGTIMNDPRCGMTRNNQPMAMFTVRTQHPQPSKASDYLFVNAFGDTAEKFQKCFRAQDRITIKGSVRTSKYEGADGTMKWITKIIADDVEIPTEGDEIIPGEMESLGKAEMMA